MGFLMHLTVTAEPRPAKWLRHVSQPVGLKSRAYHCRQRGCEVGSSKMDEFKVRLPQAKARHHVTNLAIASLRQHHHAPGPSPLPRRTKPTTELAGSEPPPKP